MRFTGLFLLAYIAGSINFAIIVLGLLGKEDPRTTFSGNAGTTNVYRQAGKLALAFLHATCVPWIGLALVAGNRFPLFHGFSGGKGVASYLGFILPISPWGAAVSCLVWVAVNRIVRIPFIASFFMILTLGGAAIAANGGQVVSIAQGEHPLPD
jgi:glycerol-3-phosphate acyltransferase PlsY